MHALVAPTLNFAVVVGILVWFGRKPIVAMISERSVLVRGQVDEAAKQKKEAETRYQEFSQKLTAFESEAKSILARAEQDGNALRAKIIDEAHKAAERIIKDAEATAEANARDYRERLTQDTILQAIGLAEKVLAEKLSDADKQKLLSDYVRGIEKQ